MDQFKIESLLNQANEIPESLKGLLIKVAPYLYKLITEQITTAGYNDFLDSLTNKQQILLETELAELDYLTPLAFLRKKIVQDLNDQKEKQQNIDDDIEIPKIRRRASGSQLESLDKKSIMIRKPSDVVTLKSTDNIERIHITTQVMMRNGYIESLVEKLPNLKTVSFGAAFERMLGVNTRALLGEKGIEIKIGRVRNVPFYDEGRDEDFEDYLKKKTVFEAMLNDPEKRHLFNLMIIYEFDNATYALKYFSEENYISVTKYAKELGLRQNLFARYIRTILIWSGYPYEDKSAISRAKNLTENLHRYVRIQNDKAYKEEEKRKYAIDGLLPPEDLPPENWDIWFKININLRNNPTFLDKLKDDDERIYIIIVNYYSIEKLNGNYLTLHELGVELGVGRERIRQLKIKGLEALGLDSDPVET